MSAKTLIEISYGVSTDIKTIFIFCCSSWYKHRYPIHNSQMNLDIHIGNETFNESNHPYADTVRKESSDDSV